MLTQNILQQTHCSGHVLDLLLCDCKSSKYLHSWNVLLPLATTCDHCTVSFDIVALFASTSDNSSSIPNYQAADYERIFHELNSIDWIYLINLSNKNIHVLYNKLLDVLLFVIENFVPVYKKNQKMKHPPLKAQLKKKLELHKLSKSNSSHKGTYLKKWLSNMTKQYHNGMAITNQLCVITRTRTNFMLTNKSFKSLTINLRINHLFLLSKPTPEHLQFQIKQKLNN